MAKEDLKRLLIQLFGDPELHQKIREQGWEGFNLSEEEIKLLTQQSCDGIQSYLGADAAKIVCITNSLPLKKE